MTKNTLQPLPLPGCRPEPIASYLKALGVMRIIANPVNGPDPEARGYWEHDTFYLLTKIDEDQLRQFLLEEYHPATAVAPWNGGSGFFPKDSTKAIEAIETGEADRFADYRDVIQRCRQLLESMELDAKPTGDTKAELLTRLRNILPDAAIDWFDAAVMLTGDGPKYPPLLGTGGNDGRLEFTNNFMQRLLKLFDPQTGSPTKSAAPLLNEALFAVPTEGLQAEAIGQFDPGSAGGANASSEGYGGRPTVNPWDFILMIEGALLFAGSVGRRLENAGNGVLCYPFCVRQSGAGYGSAADSDEQDSRAELWSPLWENAASLPELEALFAEGRAEVGKRRAVSGVDFARGVAALGVDRGVSQFVRYGFQVRNGLAYFAVPLGRFYVGRNPRLSLLGEGKIDGWVSRFTRSGNDVPASIRRVRRRLDDAIFDLAQRDDVRHWQNLLIAFGEAEMALAGAPGWRKDKMHPVPLLTQAWWERVNDSSPEFRLAAALASILAHDQKKHTPEFRCHLEPVDIIGNWSAASWQESPDRNLVWGGSTLEEKLGRVLQRRILTAERQGISLDRPTFPVRSRFAAPLGDVVKFIERHIDDARLEALLKGLMLLNWSEKNDDLKTTIETPNDCPIPAEFSLLKLCHANEWLTLRDDKKHAVRLESAISRLACAGRLSDATSRAVNRLVASNLAPMIGPQPGTAQHARRVAAALLFPLSWADHQRLRRHVIEPPPQERDSTEFESDILKELVPE